MSTATRMETSGAVILDKDIQEYMDCNPDFVIGLAEIMKIIQESFLKIMRRYPN